MCRMQEREGGKARVTVREREGTSKDNVNL